MRNIKDTMVFKISTYNAKYIDNFAACMIVIKLIKKIDVRDENNVLSSKAMKS